MAEDGATVLLTAHHLQDQAETVEPNQWLPLHG